MIFLKRSFRRFLFLLGVKAGSLLGLKYFRSKIYPAAFASYLKKEGFRSLFKVNLFELFPVYESVSISVKLVESCFNPEHNTLHSLHKFYCPFKILPFEHNSLHCTKVLLPFQNTAI